MNMLKTTKVPLKRITTILKMGIPLKQKINNKLKKFVTKLKSALCLSHINLYLPNCLVILQKFSRSFTIFIICWMDLNFVLKNCGLVLCTMEMIFWNSYMIYIYVSQNILWINLKKHNRNSKILPKKNLTLFFL